MKYNEKRMRIFSLMLAFVLMITNIGVIPLRAETESGTGVTDPTILYKHDFEDENDAVWTSSKVAAESGKGNHDYSREEDAHGNHYAKITAIKNDGSSDSFFRINTGFENINTSKPVWFVMNLAKETDALKTTLTVRVRDGSVKNPFIAVSNNAIKSASGEKTIGTLSTDWQTIAIKYNWTENKYETYTYANGALLEVLDTATFTNIISSAADAYLELTFNKFSSEDIVGKSLKIDNITAFQSDEFVDVFAADDGGDDGTTEGGDTQITVTELFKYDGSEVKGTLGTKGSFSDAVVTGEKNSYMAFEKTSTNEDYFIRFTEGFESINAASPVWLTMDVATKSDDALAVTTRLRDNKDSKNRTTFYKITNGKVKNSADNEEWADAVSNWQTVVSKIDFTAGTSTTYLMENGTLTEKESGTVTTSTDGVGEHYLEVYINKGAKEGAVLKLDNIAAYQASEYVDLFADSRVFDEEVDDTTPDGGTEGGGSDDGSSDITYVTGNGTVTDILSTAKVNKLYYKYDYEGDSTLEGYFKKSGYNYEKATEGNNSYMVFTGVADADDSYRPGNSSELFDTLDTSAPIWYVMDVATGSQAPTQVVMRFRDSSARSVIYRLNNGTVYDIAGTNAYSSADEWVTLVAKFDFEAKTYTTYYKVGNQLIQKSEPTELKNGTVKNYMEIYFGKAADNIGASLKIDNTAAFQSEEFVDVFSTDFVEPTEPKVGTLLYDNDFSDAAATDYANGYTGLSFAVKQDNGTIKISEDGYLELNNTSKGSNHYFQVAFDTAVTDTPVWVSMRIAGAEGAIPVETSLQASGGASNKKTLLFNTDSKAAILASDKATKLGDLTAEWTELLFKLDLENLKYTAYIGGYEKYSGDLNFSDNTLKRLRIYIGAVDGNIGKILKVDDFKVFTEKEEAPQTEVPVAGADVEMAYTGTSNYAADAVYTQAIIDNAVALEPSGWLPDKGNVFTAEKCANALYYLTLAVRSNPEAKATDGTLCKDAALKQLRFLIAGGNEPYACVGAYWGHAVVASDLTLIKNTPVLYDELTADEKDRMDWLMKALAITGNWGFNDVNNYSTGVDLLGNFNKEWNPNYRNTYLTAVINAALYFGADELNSIFTSFDYDAYIAKFRELGYTNILATWTTVDSNGVSIGEYMENGGAVTLLGGTGMAGDVAGDAGGNGQGVKHAFTYKGYTLNQLKEIFTSLIDYTYAFEVMNSYNTSTDYERCYILSGVDSPYTGQMGMMREFAASSGRSSSSYCWDSYMILNTVYANMKMFGGWDSSTSDMRKMDNRIFIGNEDLIYKMEQGYHGYSMGNIHEYYEYDFEYRGVSYIKDIWRNFHCMKNEVVTTLPDPNAPAEPAEPQNGVTGPSANAFVAVNVNEANQITSANAYALGQQLTSGTLEFDIVIGSDIPDESIFDSVILLEQKQEAPVTWKNTKMSIQFAKGKVNIRDGGQYKTAFTFNENYRYHAKIDFDITTQKYSVTISQTWPEEGKVYTATDFAFRPNDRAFEYVDSVSITKSIASPENALWVENVSVNGGEPINPPIPPTVEPDAGENIPDNEDDTSDDGGNTSGSDNTPDSGNTSDNDTTTTDNSNTAPAVDSNTQPSTPDSGTVSGSDSSLTESIEVTIPTGGSLSESAAVITEAFDKAENGTQIVVDFSAANEKKAEIPVDIFRTMEASEKKSELVLDLGNGFEWSIPSNGISENGLPDNADAVDLFVEFVKDVIPKTAVEAVAANAKDVKEISLSHNGPFGFKAELKIPVGREYAGMKTTLHYYNPETGKLEERSASTVDKDGNSLHVFERASDYVIVIEAAEKADSQDKEETVSQDKTEVTTQTPTETPENVENSTNSFVYILLVTVAILVIAGCIVLTIRKNKETSE